MHFAITSLLLPLSMGLSRNPRSSPFYYSTIILVLLIVVRDFFVLVVPAMMYPMIAGRATFVLMLDAACMLFVMAVMYAAKAKEDLRADIKRLKDSQYRNAPA